MRHPWRLHLLRARIRSCPPVVFRPSYTQVHSQPNLDSLSSLTLLFHTYSLYGPIYPSQPTFGSQLWNHMNPRSSIYRSLSSETASDLKDSDHTLITNIFSKDKGVDDIKKYFELNNILISHDMILRVLKKLDTAPDVARRFFNWVLECDKEKLSSKSYNLMLGILGVNGLVNEFWDLVDIMKNKGYGICKGARDRVLEKFVKDGLDGDIEKLKGVFASGSVDNSKEKICSRMCKIIRNEVWGDDVEKQLQDLNVTFSSDMVKLVLENLATDPTKALIFYRWMEESGLFKHDKLTYNAMARVLGRGDCIDRFWKIVDEMKSNGHEMELETYAKVIGRFCKRKMVKEAVDLYEFAIDGVNKPSPSCCTFLLRKIVVGKQLDMDLFSRVVRISTGNGNVLTDSMFDSVLKSMTSVGRLGQVKKVLKAMEEGGYAAGGNMQSKVALQLSILGKKDEASDFVGNLEESGCNPDSKVWASLIEGLCVAGDLDKASECLQKMLEKEGATSAAYAFDYLVSSYCRKNRAIDAYKLLCDVVIEKKLKPWHTTYKMLICKLLVQRRFEDALNILGLMKNHGFPPFLDPFIEYVSKTGTGGDAIAFTKAMTSNRFPSTSVFIRLFEAYFKAGRHSEAHEFLSKCPGFIRNHADILTLFYSMKARKGSVAA